MKDRDMASTMGENEKAGKFLSNIYLLSKWSFNASLMNAKLRLS